jgi:hypothetical protein
MGSIKTKVPAASPKSVFCRIAFGNAQKKPRSGGCAVKSKDRDLHKGHSVPFGGGAAGI